MGTGAGLNRALGSNGSAALGGTKLIVGLTSPTTARSGSVGRTFPTPKNFRRAPRGGRSVGPDRLDFFFAALRAAVQGRSDPDFPRRAARGGRSVGPFRPKIFFAALRAAVGRSDQADSEPPPR